MPESLDAKHSTEGEVTACELRWPGGIGLHAMGADVTSVIPYH